MSFKVNLKGKRFSRLFVLEFAGNRPKHRDSLWRCKCDCGNETVTDGYSLTSGNTKSCGCYQRDRCRDLFSKSDREIRINRVWFDYRKRAKQKGLKLELTKNEFAHLLDQDCYYCGTKPSNSLVQHGKNLIPYQGIDRLDNSKGYTSDNVVPCCIVCNKMKKAMSYEEFVNHILTIADRFHVVSSQVEIYYDPAEVL